MTSDCCKEYILEILPIRQTKHHIVRCALVYRYIVTTSIQAPPKGFKSNHNYTYIHVPARTRVVECMGHHDRNEPGFDFFSPQAGQGGRARDRPIIALSRQAE